MTPPAAEGSAEFEGFPNAADAPRLAALNVTLPAFTPNNASSWFKRVEALFRIKGINNTNRQADYVIGALPAETFTRLADWLDEQASDEVEYRAVKTAILQECEMSPEEKSQRLLELLRTPLGDQRPSDAFREIRALTKMTKPDGTTEILDLSRVLWMTRLPADIRTHLTDFASRSPSDLIRLADSVRGTSRLAQPVTAAASVCQAEDSDGDDVVLAAQQRRPSSKSSTRRAVSDASSKTYCYFHKRFGRDARNCREPCSFPKNM